MLLKLGRLMGVGFAGVALANIAHAEGTTVTTGATSVKLGGEFRAALNYDDHGLEKTAGQKAPDKSTLIGVEWATIKLNGNINPDTEYAFRFNLLNPGPNNGGPLDYGYGTHWFNKAVGLSVGKMRVMQGGWNHMDSGFRSHTTAVYEANLPYPDYDSMFALHLKAAGQVTLQVLNDVTKKGQPLHRKGEWNDSEHPTWDLGWMGEFGPIKPLVDLGSFDNNKSRWLDVGVKTEMNGLYAAVDYNSTSYARFYEDGGKAKSDPEVDTAFALNVAYEIKGVATPWLHFSSFDKKESSKVDGKDRKTNSAEGHTVMTAFGTPTMTAPEGRFDDNGTVLGIGADLNSFGNNFNPYVAVVSEAGKFLKADGGEESRSGVVVSVGVLGEI